MLLSAKLWHNLLLVLAFLLSVLWTNSPTLAPYTLQLTALLFLVFFGYQFSFHAKKHKAKPLLDSSLLTIIVFLLINSTGGLLSPLFFLVYFLMFGIALFLEPIAPLFLAIAMFSLLLVNSTSDNFSTLLLQLISLLMISPLALLFGKGYLKMKASDESANVLRQEGNLLEKQIKQTETKTLLFTSLELKNKLLNIGDHTSCLLSDVAHLTNAQRERLLKIRQDCLELLKSGTELERDVDKETD